MGYYVHTVEHEPFVVNDPESVLDALTEVEQKNRAEHGVWNSHISWCQPVASYRTNDNGPVAPARALSELLIDFGFETDTTGEINPLLTVTGWAGDKMGGSWNDVWQSLADGRCHAADDPDGCAVWIVRGEDCAVWAEIIGPNGHTTARVVEQYNVWPNNETVIGADMFTVGGNIFDEVR